MTKAILTLVVCTCCWPALVSGREPPPRGSLDVPARLEELRKEGEWLLATIQRKDARSVVRLFHHEGVQVSSDHSLSYDEIRRQLRTGRGLIFAVLFDTTQLHRLWSTDAEHKRLIKSLFDQFRGTHVRIEVEDLSPDPHPIGRSPGEPLWARLVYRVNGRPLEYFTDPVFTYTQEGWRFVRFFTAP